MTDSCESDAEREHMGLHNWTQCQDTYERIHIPSGLSMYDICQMAKYPQVLTWSDPPTAEEAKELAERYHKIFNRHRVGSRVITLREFDE
jgi:hypothetical protein